ncbi:DUF3850 domain-containing protein [Tumebacillus flagellatus]|uniref:DUF3850 domain-containing protein n=1 Tax=Tumebacillus flagellatus TaxID=1157490 RepID=A0A074M4B9_9BACL|nr:DUF3850 domain-containing protein [Tumebacillus flagellatus]KEO80852.1 hypothetical protein EL26_24030 [Tumebacillus flagellatus]
MTIHQLKLQQPHFDAVASGEKTFELRKDDRGFQVGDTLVLREIDPRTVLELPPGKYQGAKIRYSYIKKGGRKVHNAYRVVVYAEQGGVGE